MDLTKCYLITILMVFCTSLMAQDELEIIGEWIGKNPSGKNARVVIGENKFEIYDLSAQDNGKSKAKRKASKDVVYFKGITSGRDNEYLVMTDGDSSILRLVLHSNGVLTTHKGGRMRASTKLTRSKP